VSPELVAVLAQILAQQALVLGMQADNKQREAVGGSMAYTGADFGVHAAELERLAQAARALA
jgi:hypothetical protein